MKIKNQLLFWLIFLIYLCLSVFFSIVGSDNLLMAAPAIFLFFDKYFGWIINFLFFVLIYSEIFYKAFKERCSSKHRNFFITDKTTCSHFRFAITTYMFNDQIR
jgi:hypothetical protein